MSRSRVDLISRRRFLVNSAGFSLALPVLPSLLWSRGVEAATPPKRFISVVTSNGQRRPNWFPLEGGEPAWRVLDAANHVRDFNLTDLPSGSTVGLSKVLHPDFNAVRGKLTLIRGLDMAEVGASHQQHMMLNAWNKQGTPTVTIDQILANSSRIYATPPAKGRSLNVCIKQASQAASAFSIDSAGNQVPRVYNPLTVFNRFFGGANSSPSSQAQLTSRRRLAIDLVREEFVALRSSSRLSSEDKRRLEDHAAKITDLQARLSATPTVGCTTPATPLSREEGELNLTNLAQATRDHLDLIVLAIKCDLIRVVSISLCPGTDLRPLSFFTGNSADTISHHELSHQAACCDYPMIPTYYAQLATVNNWYARQVAYLVNELDREVEPGGTATYLDNSLVYYGNEDGNGHGNDVHTPFAMPVLLAGSAGGAIHTGKYLDYRTHGTRRRYLSGGELVGYPEADFQGRPYNQLLVTLMDIFGIPAAEYEQPGVAGIGNYNDPTGTYAKWLDSDAKRRTILPFWKKS